MMILDILAKTMLVAGLIYSVKVLIKDIKNAEFEDFFG